MTKRHPFIKSLLKQPLLLLLLLLVSCAPTAAPTPTLPSTGMEEPVLPATGATEPTATRADPTLTLAISGSKQNAEQPIATQPAEPTATAAETAIVDLHELSADQWKEWPVFPTAATDRLRQIYQKGLENGNNPRAFSVLGDCQSQPDVFMGVFDRDPEVVKSLPEPLQETVSHFSGMFDRYSTTVKDGTTEGALLWIQWNDNKEKKCEYGETPLDCELRVNKPSIVFIHIGTHYEARNRKYLTTIIDKLLEHGAVPVLVTKADNRELDERVNSTMASLAEEYNLPLWNFWASVQSLPDHGMDDGSDTYLSEAGLDVHRMGALQALDAVWRAVSAETN